MKQDVFKIMTKDLQWTMFEGSAREVCQRWMKSYHGNTGSLDHVIVSDDEKQEYVVEPVSMTLEKYYG